MLRCYHNAACRLSNVLCLILLLSSSRQFSAEAFTASRHLKEPTPACFANRTTSSKLSGIRRRRKRDIVRQSLQKLIPGLKQRPKDIYATSMIATTPPIESKSAAATTKETSWYTTTTNDDTTNLPSMNDLESCDGLGNSSGSSEDVVGDLPVIALPSAREVERATTAKELSVGLKHDDRIPLSVADTLKRRKNSLYKPPETAQSRRLNELEEEFRSMLLHFSNYTEADVLSIVDPKMRLLFEGIAASASSVPVYRAFEVLFEDLLPLRLAGRVLFRKLRKYMDRSVAALAEDIAIVSERTGLATKQECDQLEELRLLFLTTASKLNKNDRLSSDQLKETGILSDVATRVLAFESLDELIAHIDSEGNGKLGFVELVTGLWDCALEVCGIEECDPRKVLFQVLLDLNRSITSGEIDPAESTKDQQNRRKYDDMVTAFIEWKEFLPGEPSGETESRRMEIVRGCFVGAEIPGVVNALRIVYMDYRPLRFAGDIIFSLVSSRINNQKTKT